MRTVYFDPIGGAAGDMLLASLLDLGAPPREIEAALRTLPLPPESFALAAEPVAALGLRAVRVSVHTPGASGGRTLAEILALLKAGNLPERALARATRVFQRLAAAEAKVHAEPIEVVHFHEVGAVDAIVDVAGTALALEWLGVEHVRFGRLAPGHGIVLTAHGPLPIPAPATLELLSGVPIELGGPAGEWVTPTAAAILTALGTPARGGALLTVERAGVGAGHRPRSDRPNVVRALLGEWSEGGAGANAGAGPLDALTIQDSVIHEGEIVVLETAIDDQSPAALAHALEELRAGGATDVYVTAVAMKKGRMGSLITVLAAPAAAEQLAQILLRSTSSLGLRLRREERRILGRSTTQVSTPFGLVRMKETQRPPHPVPSSADGAAFLDAAPETDDVARAAVAHGVPFATVAAAARAAWEAAQAADPRRQ
jgi:pyridinium-3,5-bisthiocarboxylic acid mononucleotide nickel chelatase